MPDRPDASQAEIALGALRTLHPDKPMYTFWHYLRHRWERDRACDWTTFCLIVRPRSGWLRRASTGGTRRQGARVSHARAASASREREFPLLMIAAIK
jgi:hypothetical protein